METAAKLREYPNRYGERVERIDDPEERNAAEDWLDWCRKYALDQDPLGRPIRKPRVKPPGYSELQDFPDPTRVRLALLTVKYCCARRCLGRRDDAISRNPPTPAVLGEKLVIQRVWHW